MAIYQFVLATANLWENGKTATWIPLTTDDAGYYNVGNGARWKWTTAARSMEIDAYGTKLEDQNTIIGVRVNDGANTREYFGMRASQNQTTSARIYLPPGNSKTVELFVPIENAISVGGSPLGVYPIRVRFDAPATALSPDTPANRLVIYGDSIASGGLAIPAAQNGYSGLLKKGAGLGGYGGRVTLVSWGFRRLADDCSTGGARTAFVTALLALSPTKILITIGSNDQAVVPYITLANFTTYYTGLLDEIHSQSASMPIVCLTPIRRGAEGANGNGETMAQFRTAIQNAVSARSGWTPAPISIDGLAIFADLTYQPDGIHPNGAGAVLMRDAILPSL